MHLEYGHGLSQCPLSVFADNSSQVSLVAIIKVHTGLPTVDDNALHQIFSIHHVCQIFPQFQEWNFPSILCLLFELSEFKSLDMSSLVNVYIDSPDVILQLTLVWAFLWCQCMKVQSTITLVYCHL